ncbi:uncharacterized protein [Antedon mediterranea]|uniref:uncharacterized protein n=1 Tax=Antedon mediterranea TaxID=105859 RepID=UPI003AF4296B
MTMEEDGVPPIYVSQSSNDESYIADLIREVEMKIGPIPPSLLPAAVCGPRNFQEEEEMADKERSQTNFSKEGSKDSGIILGIGLNDESDEFVGRDAKQLHFDKNDNVQSIDECATVQKENGRIQEINNKLKKIKHMIAEIKESDGKLMQQFMYIHDGIEEIKWVQEYCSELANSCESMAYSSRDHLSPSGNLLHQKWKHKRNQSGSRELLSLYESKVSLQNLLKAGGSDRTTSSTSSHYALGWYGKPSGSTESTKPDLMHPEAYLNRRRSSVGEISEFSHFRSARTGHKRRKSSSGIIIANSVSSTEHNVLASKYNETLKLNEISDKTCYAL